MPTRTQEIRSAATGRASLLLKSQLRDGVRRLLASFIVSAIGALTGCGGESQTSPEDFQRLSEQPARAVAEPDKDSEPVRLPDGSSPPTGETTDYADEEQPALPELQEVYRPSDSRPRHDDERAAELGIARYESKRLLLYTDIDPEVAETLPPLMDQAYDAWVDYFGPLPPDREGTEYQMTGYIMRDRDRFIAAGMLPEAAQGSLIHGVHRGSEFWMNEQQYDYYRRHLMIHEGTHCYTMAVPGVRPPIWYLEGIAELFGTHQMDRTGEAEFRVMPEDRSPYVGFGRIEMIRNAIDAGESRSVDGLVSLSDADFAESQEDPYAWSWAFCKFLDANPNYQDRFRTLAHNVVGREFYRILAEEFETDRRELDIEWELFSRSIEYGYDIERSAIAFLRGEPLPADSSIAVDVAADRGWTSSGVWLEAGRNYDIAAEGEVVLANEPEPWISQPNGVSIRYASGKPIGRVLGVVINTASRLDGTPAAPLEVLDIGANRALEPTRSGTLYLRVNDFWNELADNSGKYRITIHARP